MLTLAKKEILDAFRNKVFILLLAMLFLLIIVSVVLGSIQVNINVESYNESINFLKSMGKTDFPSAPSFNPLSASKSFANYIGLLGALVAIVLGNASIIREWRGGTMRLLLSRWISRNGFISGKILGNLVLLACITLFSFIITLLAVIMVSKAPVTADEIARQGLFFLVSFLYMAFFMLLGLCMALIVRGGNKALMITVVILLVISFILPQIGDTMDLDNQLPGGFFASMGMKKEEEKKILEQFSSYETIRNGIEECSPTKHYERVGFALLNVKPGFEQNTALEVVAIKWLDFTALLGPALMLWLLAIMIFLKREDIFEE